TSITLCANHFFFKTFQHVSLREPARPSFAGHGVPYQIYQSADLAARVFERGAGFLAPTLHIAELGRLPQHGRQHRSMTPGQFSRQPELRSLPESVGDGFSIKIPQEEHRGAALCGQPRQLLAATSAIETAI